MTDGYRFAVCVGDRWYKYGGHGINHDDMMVM